jgi:hypothetical protein
MTFKLDIAKFAEKTNKNIGEAVRGIVMSVGSFVDLRSPVGKREKWADNISRASRGLEPRPAEYVGGHFRANNQYGFGSVPKTEIDGVDPTGEKAMAAVKVGVYASPVAGIHYIANRVPYAMALENGHSKQAPQGIYKLAAIDVVNEVRRIVSRKAA